MNGVGKCFKIGQVAGLRQIVRKCRKLASACDGLQAVACRLLSSWSCRVCYVSDDRHVDVVRMKKSNKGYRRSQSAIPPDVPPGHLPVYVGQQCSRRFVIRVAYLNHPVFRTLLDQAEEEFGYIQLGGLVLPCDELLFEHILRFIERQGNIVGQGFNTSSPTSLQRNP